MKKVLTLDGGGVRGLYSAIILQRIEKDCGVNIHHFFDLIVGTSTGSILASAIALNIPLEEISELYINESKNIFKKRWFSLCGMYKSKYKKEGLNNLLKKKFGQKKLKDIDKPLMIISSNLLENSVYIYKSNYLSKIEGYTRDGETLLSQAILSSCSAPTYFDPHKIKENIFLCDGGIWANNPSILALTECLSKFKEKIEDISILSIGTGNNRI